MTHHLINIMTHRADTRFHPCRDFICFGRKFFSKVLISLFGDVNLLMEFGGVVFYNGGSLVQSVKCISGY